MSVIEEVVFRHFGRILFSYAVCSSDRKFNYNGGVVIFNTWPR